MPRKSKSKSKPKTIKKQIELEVKKATTKDVEKKLFMSSTSNYGLVSAPTDADYLPILFQPSQSAGQAGRIGNKVKLLNVRIRGHANIIGTQNFAKVCQLLVVSQKVTNSTVFAGTPRILQSGNSAVGITPDVRSYYRPVNRDLIVQKKRKIFKLGSATISSATNNDFKNCVFFDFNIKVNKTILFDDVSAQPTNWNMFIVATNADITSSGASIPGTEAEYHWEAVCTYVDE